MRNQGPVDTKDKSIETKRDSEQNICFSIRSNRKFPLSNQPFAFLLKTVQNFCCYTLYQLSYMSSNQPCNFNCMFILFQVLVWFKKFNPASMRQVISRPSQSDY